jgi:predicted RecB family endonuclease
MSTNTPAATDNLAAAIELLKAEQGAEVQDLDTYLAKLAEVQDACKALRGEHAKALANLASKRSRARKAERVAKALALLDAQEKAEAGE